MNLSPYKDFTIRQIKALSNAQIDDYQTGRGMGMALAAELNQYPGPLHVLELAEKLELDPQQQRETEKLFEQMRMQAVALGKQIIEHESELDQLFADRAIDEQALAAKLALIAKLQGELRHIHLKTHLKMRELLTPHQVHAYVKLRGYANKLQEHKHSAHH